MEIYFVPEQDCEYELQPATNSSSHYNHVTSDQSYTPDEHSKVSLDLVLPVDSTLLNEATSLTAQYPFHAKFIESLFHKMFWYPRFPADQIPSELAMRSIQSTIVDMVYNLLQQKFPTLRFELLANQAIDCGLKPDNIIYLILNEKRVPLLIGEDKAAVSNNDYGKALDLIRLETRDTVCHIAQRSLDQVEKYAPLIYITSGFTFSLYRFNKFVEDTGSTFKTLANLCSHLKIDSSDAHSYKLHSIADVYNAVWTATSVLTNTIETVTRYWKKAAMKRNKLELTPKKSKKSSQMPSYVTTFKIQNDELKVFANKQGTIIYSTLTEQLLIVKYVEKSEALLFQIAQNLSPISVPGRIVKFELQLPKPFALIMELGKPLSDVLIKTENVHSIFLRLLQGVKEYHKGNFIHRDIKPNNLLVRKELYIIDFGLSIKFIKEENGIAFTHLGPLTEYAGTSSFMAPEMLAHKPYGTKIDCFGCGMVMLFVLGKAVKEPFKSREDYVCTNKREQFFCRHIGFAKYEPIIAGLLQADPTNRSSAETAYSQLCMLGKNEMDTQP